MKRHKKLLLNHETLRVLKTIQASAGLGLVAGGQAIVSGSQIKTCCWPDPPAQGGAA